MKTFILFGLGVFFSVTGVASESAKFVFEGRDRSTGQACALYVLDAEVDPSGLYKNVRVQSSYTHEDEESPEFVLNKASNRPDTYMGQNGKDQFALQFKANSFRLEDVVSFSIRWLHGHHYHTDTCTQLQLMP